MLSYKPHHSNRQKNHNSDEINSLAFDREKLLAKRHNLHDLICSQKRSIENVQQRCSEKITELNAIDLKISHIKIVQSKEQIKCNDQLSKLRAYEMALKQSLTKLNGNFKIYVAPV